MSPISKRVTLDASTTTKCLSFLSLIFTPQKWSLYSFHDQSSHSFLNLQKLVPFPTILAMVSQRYFLGKFNDFSVLNAVISID